MFLSLILLIWLFAERADAAEVKELDIRLNTSFVKLHLAAKPGFFSDRSGQLVVSYGSSENYDDQCILTEQNPSCFGNKYALTRNLYVRCNWTGDSVKPASVETYQLDPYEFIQPIEAPFELQRDNISFNSAVLSFSQNRSYAKRYKTEHYFVVDIECTNRCCNFTKFSINLTDSNLQSGTFVYGNLLPRRNYTVSVRTVVPKSQYTGNVKHFTFATPPPDGNSSEVIDTDDCVKVSIASEYSKNDYITLIVALTVALIIAILIAIVVLTACCSRRKRLSKKHDHHGDGVTYPNLLSANGSEGATSINTQQTMDHRYLFGDS